MKTAMTKRAATGGLKATRAPTEMQRLQAQLDRWFLRLRETKYRIGAALCLVREQKLWMQAGFTSFGAYLDALRGPSRRTLQRYMLVATGVTLEVALAMDSERLEAALHLLPTKKGKATPVTLAALQAIRIPVLRDGSTVRVPLTKATTDELQRAVADAEHAALPETPAEVVAAREAVERKLNSGAGALGDVYVRFRGKKRVLVVEVPIERAAEFQARLR